MAAQTQDQTDQGMQPTDQQAGATPLAQTGATQTEPASTEAGTPPPEPTETSEAPQTAPEPPTTTPPSQETTGATITPVDDHFTTEQNSPLVVHGADVLANDGALAGHPLHIVSVGQGEHGVADYDAANDLLTFTPNDTFLGHTTFHYTVADDAGHTGTANVDVFIATEVANGPPKPQDDHFSTKADQPLTIGSAQLTANDHDPQDLPMSVAGVQNASHGTVGLDPQTNQITFTPDPQFTGTAGFDYVVTDATRLAATGHVSIDVAPSGPMAVNDIFATEENTLLVLQSADLLANDRAGDGGPLHLVSVGQAVHGQVSYDGGKDLVFLQPDQDYLGHATFSYVAADQAGQQATGAVDVSVNTEVAMGPPIPRPDTFSATADQQLRLTTAQLIANDHDPLGLPMSVVDVRNLSHGSVQFDFKAGTIQFTPEQHFVGTAGFDYVLTGSGHMALTGHVAIDVKALPPDAQDDAVTVQGGQATTLAAASLLANDRAALPDDPLHIASVGGGSHGSVGLTNQGDVVFTPDRGFSGDAGFSYTVADKFGGTDNAGVNVHVNAEPATTQTTPPPQIVEVREIVHDIVQTIPVFVHVPATTASTQPTEAWFVGHSTAHGTELWTTDGLSAGEAADIFRGAASSFPSNLQLIGETLFFSANDGSHGREPWILDGQTAHLMADIRPGVLGSNPTEFTLSGRSLFFAANDGDHGRELWTADSQGVHQVADIAAGLVSSNPADLVDVQGTLFFTANDRVHGTELWQVGADGRPTLVSDIAGGLSGANPHDLTAVDDTLYFVADDGQHGRELYHVAADGNVVAEDIFPGAGSAFPRAAADHALASDGKTLYVAADVPGDGLTLFAATAGDQAVHPLARLGVGADAPMTAVRTVVADSGREVYVAAADNAGNSELVRYDVASGHLSGNLAPDAHSAPADLTVVGDTLFFTALNGASDGGPQFRGLWEDSSDGLQRVDLGSDRTLPHGLSQADGRLLFAESGHLHAVLPHADAVAMPIPSADGTIYLPSHITGMPVEPDFV